MNNAVIGAPHPWKTSRAFDYLTAHQKRKWKHLWTLFPRMVDVLPEGKCGQVEIYHFDVTQCDAWLNYQRRGELWTPGRFVQLMIGGVGWMYDILHERIMNEIIVQEARGEVLIGGLGIGMILHPILAKPEVRSVRVLENNLHIAELVLPSLATVPGAEKLTVELCDAQEWASEGRTFDAIWLDCVPCYGYGWNVLNLQESWMKAFQPHLREGGFLGHWGFLENLQWILDEQYKKAGRPPRKRAFPMGKAEEGLHVDKGDLEAMYYGDYASGEGAIETAKSCPAQRFAVLPATDSGTGTGTLYCQSHDRRTGTGTGTLYCQMRGGDFNKAVSNTARGRD